jgi:hypothetical protein
LSGADEKRVDMLHSDADAYRRGFSLLGMRILLGSNNRDLIADDEYFLGKGAYLHSLLSNFNKLDEIPPPDEPDVVMSVIDIPGSPISFSRIEEGRYAICGEIAESERSCKDKRASIFGNMGLFSKLLIRELEIRGIYSIHSTSFLDRKRNRLFVVIGGSGSGKSTVLLKAISLGGMEVFGTEITHFSFQDGGTRMIKGSLWQNCRMGNLVIDFPELLGRFGLDEPTDDPWHVYKSVPLHDIQTREDVLDSVSIVIVMPRIEGERSTSSIRLVSKGSLRSAIFQNLSDKVSPPSLLWGAHFIPSLDSADRQTARMAATEKFINEASIVECWNVLASPAGCLDGIFPGDREAERDRKTETNERTGGSKCAIR